MSAKAFLMAIGGQGQLVNDGASQIRRSEDKNGPPSYLAFPTFRTNLSYDPAGSGDDQFERWANWLAPSSGSDARTTTWKLTANPSGGSGNYRYDWALPMPAGAMAEDTEYGNDKKDFYVAQAGTTSVPSTRVTCTVTDTRTNESFAFEIFISVTRSPGGGTEGGVLAL